MNDIDIDRILQSTAFDADGNKIGQVGEIYLDDQTSEPTFVAVNTGLFGLAQTLVPLRGHRWDGEDLVLPYDKDLIKDAPRVEATEHLSEQEQDELFRYYENAGAYRDAEGTAGVGADRGDTEVREGFGTDTDVREDRVFDVDAEGGVDARETDTTRDAFADGTVTEDGASMTRSEEHLNVGTEQVETGRVRLRKYTTTEQEQVNVPVTKEKVVVERHDVDGRPAAGIDANADEQVEEIVTREERPVIDKETVAVEEVNVGKETVTEQQTVSDEVRKEHIEVEGAEGVDVDERDERTF